AVRPCTGFPPCSAPSSRSATSIATTCARSAPASSGGGPARRTCGGTSRAGCLAGGSPVRALPRHVRRTGPPADDAGAERAQVVAIEVALRELGAEHGGKPVQGRT